MLNLKDWWKITKKRWVANTMASPAMKAKMKRDAEELRTRVHGRDLGPHSRNTTANPEWLEKQIKTWGGTDKGKSS